MTASGSSRAEHASRKIAGWLVAALVSTMIISWGAPAFAHTELVGTDPKKGSTVNKLVDAVTLTFTEPVSQAKTTVGVFGPSGESFSDGTPRSVNAKVIQKVRSLPEGRIRVVWKTVSSDGHTLRGEFTFTNHYVPPSTAPPTTQPAATPSPASPTATPAAVHAAVNEGTSATGWWIAAIAGAVIVLAGAALAIARRRRHGSDAS